MKTNLKKKRYDIQIAKNGKEAPVWPDETYESLVARAYGDRIIRDLNHPVVRKLNGDFEEAA
jgi:hypothetical protein